MPEHEQKVVLKEVHEGITGGHFAGNATARKVMSAGLWWPTLFKDAARHAKVCDPCQRIGETWAERQDAASTSLTVRAF